MVLTPVVAVFISLQAAGAAVDFSRDIQPIFARHCYECHGEELQKGKLRLDLRDAFFKGGSSGPAVVSGKAAQSELYRRVTLPKGHEDIMPSRGEPLSKAQADLIRDWINQGAPWPENAQLAKHWAYVKPERPALPKVKNRKWAINEIDRFILAKLEKEKLKPSPEADRAQLLRRVFLDLTGLPPSPEDVAAFLADKSPRAYENFVDRLLASPQYGERWARPWLDAARYADSLGYQRDDLFDLWPYRDWVVRALNADIPFDQFTIEQIAGDLLPNATLDQKIATGFNRCVPTNVEAGSDQEETRTLQVFDRVNTLGSVWLGSTLECAQCHNHKYDPFSQKEYYQLFAFFNNTPQETDFSTARAMATLKFTGPYMPLPDTDTDNQRRSLEENIKAVEDEMAALTNRLAQLQAEWEKAALSMAITRGQAHVLEVSDFDSTGDSFHTVLEDKSLLLSNGDNDPVPLKDTYTVTVNTSLANISAFKLEVLTDPSLPAGGPGRGHAKAPNFVLNEFTVTASRLNGDAAAFVKLSNAKASHSQVRFSVANAIDGNPQTGWAIKPEFFKDHWAVFETAAPVGFTGGTRLVFVLEQSNGFRRTIGRFRLSAITGKAGADSLPSDIVQILRTDTDKRTAAQKRRLTEYHRLQDPAYEKLKTRRAQLANELKNLKPPQTLVMQELDQPRMSALFVRGNFMETGEPVQPGVPAVLHTLPDGPPNRLTLARWLVDRNNPLVARVTVNRWWAELFGQGLVTTPEDFGIKGELPTHPELLDWLAVEFMESGWDMKAMHKLLVMSATYRQSSRITPQLFEKDDQNKLYARGPRFRMDAEMIRDNALAAAGLLSLKQGGPSVRPYQPPGLWESKVGGEAITYVISEGEDRYRRGLYVVLKPTSPYPSFINFDATARNACIIKRSRSNTPLQALTLLNDPVYVEAATALARRIVTEKPTGKTEDRIRHAFLVCVVRTPSAKEINAIGQLFRDQWAAAQADPESARKLIGDCAVPEGMTAEEFCAWQAVAWALLNLDETITKG